MKIQFNRIQDGVRHLNWTYLNPNNFATDCYVALHWVHRGSAEFAELLNLYADAV